MKFWDTKLLITILCCSAICIWYSFFLSSYVMPNLNKRNLSLAERVTSTSFGDSFRYGKYAEGILKNRSFKNEDGKPILRHMPGFPLILAISFEMFDSAKPLVVFQILFFFVSLYFFLVRIKGKFPAIILILTVLIMTFHPLMAKIFTGVVSDLLFSSLLLWVAFVLWKDSLNTRDFFCVGLLLGIAVYIRESAFPFMMMVGLAYLIKDRKKYLKPVTLMACAFLILLSPWVIRNYIQTHKFIPLTTKGIQLFYSSSIPLTTDFYKFKPFGKSGYDYKYRTTREYQNLRGNRKSYDGSNKREFNPVKEGIYNYVSRPREQAVSMLLKTVALFNKPPLLARDLPRMAEIGLTVFNVFFYIFHIGIILFGIILSFRTKFNPFIYLPYLITAQYFQALFFFSEPRYLMPFYPFLIVVSLSWYWNNSSQWSGNQRCREGLQMGKGNPAPLATGE